MNDEFERLTSDQQAAVDRVIALAREHREQQTLNLPDGSDVYAYPHARGIAWGVNGGENGFNIARGVRLAQ